MIDLCVVIFWVVDQFYVIEIVYFVDFGLGEVLVKIVVVGMCYIDFFGCSGLLGEYFFFVILGYEGLGIVDVVGFGVVLVKVGDYVVLIFGSCGNCVMCEQGEFVYCFIFEFCNFLGYCLDGIGVVIDDIGILVISCWFVQFFFGEYVIVMECNVVVVDFEVLFEFFGLFGCGIQIGVGVVFNEMKLFVGQLLVVFGVGVVGLLVVMVVKFLGVSDIVVIDFNVEC